MAIRIAIMGAGGKMGIRAVDKLKGDSRYDLVCVEIGQAGIASLAERGLTPESQDEATAGADVVLLALPDRFIGPVTQEIVPGMKSGAMVMGLDPAATYAGVIPIRNDLSYFVAHPCHPPLFEADSDPDTRHDWFGGIAPQHLVCALHHGPEADYAKGETIAIDLFGPIIKAHRITVEQMAILEPALVETTLLPLVGIIKEAYDEAVSMGVPAEAAWAFLLGHLRVEFGIVFGLAGFPVSDGAKQAMEKGRQQLIQPNWKENIFDLDKIRQSVAEITDSLTT